MKSSDGDVQPCDQKSSAVNLKSPALGFKSTVLDFTSPVLDTKSITIYLDETKWALYYRDIDFSLLSVSHI